MTRDELIKTIAEVMAGLQVPISISGEMGVNVLGVADAPARELLGLVGGWAKPEEFEAAFTKIIDGPSYVPPPSRQLLPEVPEGVEDEDAEAQARMDEVEA